MILQLNQSGLKGFNFLISFIAVLEFFNVFFHTLELLAIHLSEDETLFHMISTRTKYIFASWGVCLQAELLQCHSFIHTQYQIFSRHICSGIGRLQEENSSEPLGTWFSSSKCILFAVLCFLLWISFRKYRWQSFINWAQKLHNYYSQ